MGWIYVPPPVPAPPPTPGTFGDPLVIQSTGALTLTAGLVQVLGGTFGAGVTVARTSSNASFDTTAGRITCAVGYWLISWKLQPGYVLGTVAGWHWIGAIASHIDVYDNSVAGDAFDTLSRYGSALVLSGGLSAQQVQIECNINATLSAWSLAFTRFSAS
jgi:hypothetical protein